MDYKQEQPWVRSGSDSYCYNGSVLLQTLTIFDFHIQHLKHAFLIQVIVFTYIPDPTEGDISDVL